MIRRFKSLILPFLILGSCLVYSTSLKSATAQNAHPFFIRFKLISVSDTAHRVVISGYRHEGAPWRFPQKHIDIKANEWTPWIDLTGWKWHGRVLRAGGIAEFPSISLTAISQPKKKQGYEFAVELSESPKKGRPEISFKEKTEGNSVIFLAPYPLKANKKDFETAREMAARHARWAKEATDEKPINIGKFEIISNLWTRHDPYVVEKELGTLKTLGFNVFAGSDFEYANKFGMKTVGKTNTYVPDPAQATKRWDTRINALLGTRKSIAELRKLYSSMAYYEISDEVSALDFRRSKKPDLDAWFRSYLRSKKLTEKDLGKDIEDVSYPLEELYKNSLPKNTSLENRRFLFYAAKFGQWWSVKQLKHTTNLIRKTFPGMETGTLLPSHGFLGNAWGPTKIGMSYQMLDSFELAEQQAVSQISTEDWLGLNHMYGPQYTWSGGQTFGYLNALNRSAIGNRPIVMRTFLTVSDDKYLRIKAHSAIGQGVKSFYFWSYGPTFASTENYWSDLKSHYFGVAKLNRSLEKTEDVLHPAKTVSDPVAILYSVSHDIWNNNRQAVFTERRLLWHGLRHLHVQPDFVREEDLEGGRLKDYKVLYVTDWNISKKASSAIDKWIKRGGIVYLSAGAATRDEFNSLHIPSFLKSVLGKDEGASLTHQSSTYNERTSLAKTTPLDQVKVEIGKKRFAVPVIGVRSNVKEGGGTFARFGDGKTAGRMVSYGRGKVIVLGFMPMLAYGHLANFKPKELKEKWKPEPRELLLKPLTLASIKPVASANIPVVEVNYLKGPKGAAIVLANYTYQKINNLVIKLKLNQNKPRLKSSKNSDIQIMDQTPDWLTIKTSLDWTDIITIQ